MKLDTTTVAHVCSSVWEIEGSAHVCRCHRGGYWDHSRHQCVCGAYWTESDLLRTSSPNLVRVR